MNQSNDKRHFSRIPMEAQARLVCTYGELESQLVDISLRGALVQRPASWTGKVGDHCLLQVGLRDSDVTISMDVVVAHTSAEFMGFRCEQIDLASISHLRRLVELNLGDERLLERELNELIASHA